VLVQGVEAYGVAGHRLFYAAGVVNGISGNGRFAGNDGKDLYARVDYKIGGMGLDGDLGGREAPDKNWRDDSLRLVDKQGTVLLELNEVEAGMYETTPSHTHYFLQTLAAINKERITDDLFGEWQFSRGTARVICQMTLGNTAYDTDSFVLTLKPGCDPLIARFAPVSWRLDRGQFVMLAANGQSWRFEENEESTWSRVPAARPQVLMVRPQAPPPPPPQ